MCHRMHTQSQTEHRCHQHRPLRLPSVRGEGGRGGREGRERGKGGREGREGGKERGNERERKRFKRKGKASDRR